MTDEVAAPSLGRDAASITAWNLVSRITGFVRIVVVSAVLGTTVLGDTYQTTNTVPNVVFELFAAGTLQAVLVPALVRQVAQGGREAADRLAGMMLGGLAVVLGSIALVAALASPLISRGLFAGASDATRDDQVRLGIVLLLVFLPQVLFYAAGAVSTAVLHAGRRFAVPAFAPVINNVVVCGAYALFWALHHDATDPLHLTPVEVLVLGGGTTLGVVAFTSVPYVAARRLGYRLRPVVALGDPDLRRLARQGLWAGLFLALTQAVLVAALVAGNRAEGGVVTYQLAYTYFLLPHALVAIPILTAAFPGLAEAFHRGDETSFADQLRRAVSALALLALPATALLVALADAATRVTLFGRSAGSAGRVADALIAFAPGLVAYGLFLLLTRAAYARDEVRLPTRVHLVVTAVAVLGMIVAAATLDDRDLVTGLAASHTVAFVVGAAWLGLALRHRTRTAGQTSWFEGATVAKGVLAAATAGVVAHFASDLLDDGSRVEALGQLAVGGIAGVLAFGAVVLALGVPVPGLSRRTAGEVTGG